MKHLKHAALGIALGALAAVAHAGSIGRLPLGGSSSQSGSCPADPVPQATSGYGSNGPYAQASVSFENPASFGQKVYIFYPQGATPAPTIFFSHAYGARDPDRYTATIAHLNSRGYTVVFAQYPTEGKADPKYDTLWGGFQAAVQKHPELIDTSRVAFFGHSFGGGATPRMTLNGLASGWGRSGTAMYIMAPWYSLRLTDANLASFPAAVKMVMETFEDDTNTDHQMSIDLYRNISIPAANKAYIRAYSDTQNGCTLLANHTAASNESEAPVNGLHYWNWYHMDGLLAYTFTGNTQAQQIALGGGDAAQTYWGTWSDGVPYRQGLVTTSPTPANTSCSYKSPCDDSDNPRAASCLTFQKCKSSLFGNTGD
jgi:hypothetical protein